MTGTININDAQAVAENLPGAWRAVQTHPHAVTLIRVHDSLKLSMVASNGKVQVSLTGLPHEHVRYSEKRPSINVTLTPARSRTVARDITRRLLPDAEALNAVVRERMAAQAAYENRREMVAASLHLTINEHGTARINEGSVWGEATVSNDSVALNLHNLSPAQALAVLNVIRDV